MLLLFQACQEEIAEPEQVTGNATLADPPVLNDNTLTEQDRKMMLFAQSLAKSLKDAELRSFVKTEANKQFDGEHNILYEFVRDQKIGKQELSARLADNIVVANSNLTARTNARILFNEGMQDIPLLNIGVPLHSEEWDTESFIPLVAVLTSDFSEQNSKWIRAYNNGGELTYVDAKNEPTVPVVVVRLNERLEITTSKKGQLHYQARYASISDHSPDYVKARINQRYEDQCRCEDDGGSGGGGSGSGGSSSGCSRNGMETIKGIEYANIASMRSAESWSQEDHELRFVIYEFIEDGTGEEIADKGRAVKRGDLQYKPFPLFHRWRTSYASVGLGMFRWDKNTHPDKVIWQFYERDFSGEKTTEENTIEIEDKNSGIKTKTTTKIVREFEENDFDLGRQVVSYCDATPKSYHDIGYIVASIGLK
ncbi:hypothetical protein [Tunicatimonas pelagia]|uniref:hypothetical protein n=1 Tax=Tunicatimonas pelagia TaxID=931531 RepID=UPI002665BA4A|nr:hypothetical protein [Tunicatimonas pelagia]WKN44083.1 hypothetical protein P0M28_03765 [Tunicatimonas pelagia]